MKQFLLLCTFICSLCATAQQPIATKATTILSVDSNDIYKLAQKSSKKNTLFFTFGIWCEPCRLHLPTAIKLAKDYDLEFYVLLVDSQTSDRTSRAIDYLQKLDKDIKIAVLKDAVYGDKTQKRNTKFVKEITPPQFEMIDGFSKYILLDKTGKVIMVTNWKDNPGSWEDDSDMVQIKIVPLLK
ncbi:thiol-disulfide isomerase/thioredoxin [Flavobacterium arsenatis]|uniref:Thiol-disulfide isomerase/thioredoxin n=1 Tax=Flavobacterium arsenatis TaxID=1484332 RepID=A0ABU1TN53_9FLAO|nr:thioredoxin family protein [Flavobacterium arsenatis]MDR6967301.1 thiol-disulfide isomerase/thioredoxin [Flavobacterium arsenatis]